MGRLTHVPELTVSSTITSTYNDHIKQTQQQTIQNIQNKPTHLLSF